MEQLPAIELLESTHQFPGPYMFKVIGRVDNGFVVDPPFSVREAVGGRHVAVTLQPRLQSAHQVLAVYRRVRSLAGLVLLW